MNRRVLLVRAPASVLCATFALGLQPTLAEAVEGNAAMGWTLYRNERFGFMLTYPQALMKPEAGVSDAGIAISSPDKRVRLLAGAGPNEGNDTLESYRQFLLGESYKDVKIDYAPVRSTWFVLSGIRGDQMFYERVTFACGGRMIHGWQLIYPVAERALYDRVVEAIHRSYRVGRGDGGTC
jgi:hypothetical protein